jgi:hypothetical protein
MKESQFTNELLVNLINSTPDVISLIENIKSKVSWNDGTALP